MHKAAVIVAGALAMAIAMPAQGPARRGPGAGPMGRGMGVVGGWPAASRTPVTGAPYSAVQVVQIDHPLADGNKIQRQQESRVWRDGQGRERIERTPANAPAGQAKTSITIFDPAAGFAYMLNPANQTAIKWPMHPPRAGAQGPGPRAARGRGPGAAAEAKEEDLGTQTIEGAPATGERTTRTIPAGAIGNQEPIQMVHEVWTSTTLKVPVLIKSSDPRSGNTTIQLTKITLGEPDPALFQVPQNYTVTERQGGPGGMGAGMGRGMGGGMGRNPRN